MTTQKRKHAESWGRKAEGLAETFFCDLGFDILARRVRTPAGEIDLIACKDNLLVFTEVKARQQKPDGLYAITPRQQGRIIAATEIFLAEHSEYKNHAIRFDAVICTTVDDIHHIPDAWRPEF